jgi:CheY-like chemotaxis protein
MAMPTAAIPMTDDGTTLQIEEKRCLSNGMNDYLSKPSTLMCVAGKLYTNLNLPSEKSRNY